MDYLGRLPRQGVRGRPLRRAPFPEGFRTPRHRIQTDLVDRGLLPEEADDLLEPMYPPAPDTPARPASASGRSNGCSRGPSSWLKVKSSSECLAQIASVSTGSEESERETLRSEQECPPWRSRLAVRTLPPGSARNLPRVRRDRLLARTPATKARPSRVTVGRKDTGRPMA